jgi:hypothetical protein
MSGLFLFMGFDFMSDMTILINEFKRKQLTE